MTDPRIYTASREPRTAANRLREVRVSKGMSQRELAREAGVHRATVQAIERGAQQPLNVVLGCLAAALGVDPAELAADPGPGDAP
jgi:transcriptional regulator with XRE-family HTH domain